MIGRHIQPEVEDFLEIYAAEDLNPAETPPKPRRRRAAAPDDPATKPAPSPAARVVEVRAPAELAHLARLIGDEGLFKLIEACGGTRVYLGHKARARGATSDLARVIGRAAARRLAEEYGTGGFLRVPVARPWRCQVYRARGMSNERIARALCCDVTTVERILGPRKPGAPGQLSLALG